MNHTNYQLLQYGLFDSTVKFPNVITTEDRLLDCFEIDLFTASYPGTGYINGSPYKFEEGLVLCGKPGQYRHSRLHFKCCYLHFTVSSPELRDALLRLPDGFIVTDFDELAALFYRMSTLSDESVSDALLLHSYANRILHRLIRLSENRPAPATPLPSVHAQTLSEVKKYIKNHYAEKLPLSLLAEKAALSPVYFHRLFTAQYGTTPADYTLQIRIAAAKQLLLTTDRPLARVAADCGFSSQAYFNYSFKKQTGLSPIRYRKKMLSRLDL